LSVEDSSGAVRSLLSYKVATDALVVGFYSPRCALNQEVWWRLKRFYERYRGWHVSFVGVSVASDETLGELLDAMAWAGLPYPAVRDLNQQAARKLHVLRTPEILVIDEWGQLRYRGPVDGVSKAVEAVVGQEQVENPDAVTFKGCPIQ
jgi:hypothetical protein